MRDVPQQDAEDRELGDRIARAMEASGLTVAQLALATGLSRSFVHHLLNGARSPSIAKLRAIAAACGVSPARLLEDSAGDLLSRESRAVVDSVETRLRLLEQRISPSMGAVAISAAHDSEARALPAWASGFDLSGLTGEMIEYLDAAHRLGGDRSVQARLAELRELVGIAPEPPAAEGPRGPGPRARRGDQGRSAG
jgi:transcriptional regulator with XRE-family HTH domain